MNRRVVRYSTFGSIAVAIVAGTVYLLMFSDSQAEEGSTEISARTSAASPASSGRSTGVDPLFSAPLNIGRQDEKPPVPNPFQRDADISRAGYNQPAPRRLAHDPNAMPLGSQSQPAFNPQGSSRAQLTAGSQAETNSGRSPAADPPLENLALQNALPAAPPTSPVLNNTAAQRQPSSRNPAGNATATNATATNATATNATAGGATAGSIAGNAPAATQAPRGSAYGAPPAGLTADQRLAAPSPQPPRAAREPLTSGFENRGSSIFDSPDTSDVSQFGAARNGAPESTADTLRNTQPANRGLTAVAPASDPKSPRHDDSSVGSSAGASAGFGSRATNPTASAPESSLPAAQATATGAGRPGSRQVEGPQTPQVIVEKQAPAEVQVGEPAKIELRIQNTGTVPAHAVHVRDFVPAGTTFVAAQPPANPGIDGRLEWSLGTLKPGDETTIQVEVTPTTEGEMGSVAVVSFATESGARSRVTKPDLTLQVTSDKEVMIGRDVAMTIKIANPGSGAATGVVLEERVPPGLKHAAGPELEFEVGTLKPGETRELELVLTAAQAGRIVNQLAARADGNLEVQAQCELEVIAPALEIQMDGPSRRYLERQATYTVSVSNPGTATAKDIELVTRLPRGLKFVKANNAGHYDANTHSVTWALEELPPSITGTVMLTAIPVEPGEQRLRAEGRAQQNLTDEQEQVTVVEGMAAILFQVMDVADPIEINGQTEYEIRVTNQGSKAADNVRLVALVPAEMKFVSAEGPTRHAAAGQQVVFEPLSRLAPKAETSYRVVVQGMRPGDLRMRVQVTADDLEQPIIKEESTRVYSDE